MTGGNQCRDVRLQVLEKEKVLLEKALANLQTRYNDLSNWHEMSRVRHAERIRKIRELTEPL